MKTNIENGKKISYLKDIGAYDFNDKTMISILMDFIPDELHKEVSMKYDITSKKTITLKQIQSEIEKIIQREKIEPKAVRTARKLKYQWHQ